MPINSAAPQILWGTNYENVLDFPIFDNVVTGRRPRDGSVQGRTSGVQVSWVEGWDYWMKGDARWIPDQDLTTPFVATGWSGPTGWQAFLDWARTWPNTFRFVPDRTVPAFYVDGCYLTAPFEEEDGQPETDGTRSVSITVQNPTVDFSQALRGIMFEYAPGMSLTDPVAATFTRAGVGATRVGVDGSVYDEAANVLRDRHYINGVRGALFEGVRQNKIENGDYEADAVGSLGRASATVVRDTTQFHHGVASLKVTTADLVQSGVTFLKRDGSRIAAVAARLYTVEMDVFAPAASVGKTLRVGMEWWDVIPAQLSSSLGPSVALVAGWQRYIFTASSPATTAFGVPFIECNAAQGIFDFWVDVADFQEGAFASEPIPTNTAAVTRNGDQGDFPVRVPMSIDWTLYLSFFARHANVATWSDTEPQTDPLMVVLASSAALVDTDNGGAIMLHRQNSSTQYEWEYQINRVTAVRTFSITPNPQKLVLRHHASDHHLSIAIDGGAFVDGAAPTTVAIPVAQLLLRLRNNGFWTLFRAKLAHGLRTQAVIETL